MWMNEYEIENALVRYANHPVAGPATATLQALVYWTNNNSDGWPYWQKPARAADKLMDLIREHDFWDRDIRHLKHAEATAAALKAALVPLKSFRTRHSADFPIYETVADLEAAARRRAEAIEAAERAELARLQTKYGS